MRYLPLVIIIVLLAGCSSGSKFASSFGKRKYNKGYYVDLPGHIEKDEAVVARKEKRYPKELPVISANATRTPKATINRNIKLLAIKPAITKTRNPVLTAVAAKPANAAESVVSTVATKSRYGNRTGYNALWITLGIILFLGALFGGLELALLIAGTNSALRVVLIIAGLVAGILIDFMIYCLISDNDPAAADAFGEVAGDFIDIFVRILFDVL